MATQFRGDRPVMNIELVAPSVAYRTSFLQALREFQREGLPWWFGGDLDTVESDFAGFVANKLADAHGRGGTTLPKTQLWAIADGQFVGRIGVLHALNDALRVEGGHIGYDTVPSARGRGVATEMLRQALPIAAALGLTAVLLTCDDSNTASIRVIEKNGGVLHGIKAVVANKPPKRYYWITLP